MCGRRRMPKSLQKGGFAWAGCEPTFVINLLSQMSCSAFLLTSQVRHEVSEHFLCPLPVCYAGDRCQDGSAETAVCWFGCLFFETCGAEQLSSVTLLDLNVLQLIFHTCPAHHRGVGGPAVISHDQRRACDARMGSILLITICCVTGF